MTRRVERRLTRRVALVTCAELPLADAETRMLIAPLAARGVSAYPVVWDDAQVDWASFDLAVIRSCWDYTARRSEFVTWAAAVPRLMNPGGVIAWNTDKSYLAELAAAGIGVVPTTWLHPVDDGRLPWQLHDATEWVVKPAVSLAALDTGRYDITDPEHRRLAGEHVRRLQQAGRTVMVQPYVTGIDTAGEVSLVFIEGRFSHAVRKGPVLAGPESGMDRRFAATRGLDLRPHLATPIQLDIAERALAAAPASGNLLYARVDLVPDDDGAPLVMEVELTEPMLYFALAPAAAEHLASAIAARAGA
ncbi:MAG TPA: hypothetical protein VFZ69_03105 [Longimicrobiales bacterium]